MLQIYRDPPYGLPVPMKSTSVLLDDETRREIALIAEHHRIKPAQAIRFAVAELARKIRAEQAAAPRAKRKG